MADQKHIHDADALDQLFDALQHGQELPSLDNLDETDIALAQAIVGLVKETKPDPHFTRQTEHSLTRQSFRRKKQPLWLHIYMGTLAGGTAAILILLVGLIVYFVSEDNLDNSDSDNSNLVGTQILVGNAVSPTPTATGTPTPARTSTPLATQLPVNRTREWATVANDYQGIADFPPSTATTLPSGPNMIPDNGNTGNSADVEVTPQPTVIAMHPTQTPLATFAPSSTALASPPPASSGTEVAIFLTATQSAPAQNVTQVPTVTPVADFQSNLEAGEIDDNAEFNVYLQYRRDFARYQGLNTVHDVDIAHRHTIQVLNNASYPVLGATVSIYDMRENLVAELTTSATGIVYFFPRAYPTFADTSEFLVDVTKDQTTASFNLTRAETDMEWLVTLDVEATPLPVQVDILFLVDSTGSMSDEINELKLNILSMSAQIDEFAGEPDVRYGLVTYRDRNDAYVVQTTDFTGDVGQFQTTLAQLRAGGGGDNPESLNEALHSAISEVSWREGNTIKIIILVADAPPHLDYPQDYDYAEEILLAAEQGIKIHAIASSGLNDTGEYIFRQIAQFTGGNFIFLTYENAPQSPSSNEPGAPGTDHHVPEQQYTVEYLDGLVVRLIEAEIAAVQTRQE